PTLPITALASAPRTDASSYYSKSLRSTQTSKSLAKTKDGCPSSLARRLNSSNGIRYPPARAALQDIEWAGISQRICEQSQRSRAEPFQEATVSSLARWCMKRLSA